MNIIQFLNQMHTTGILERLSTPPREHLDTLPTKSYTPVAARGGAVEARWAHNPKVVGSNPTPATKETAWHRLRPVPFFILHRSCYVIQQMAVLEAWLR